MTKLVAKSGRYFTECQLGKRKWKQHDTNHDDDAAASLDRRGAT